MNDQLEMFTTTLGLAGQRTRPALDTPTVAIAKNAPDTSREAGEKAKEHSGKQRELIYFWIKWAAKTNAKGATADEISLLTDLPAQSISARINGLHKDGYVLDTGLRRKTRYGRNAIVWRNR